MPTYRFHNEDTGEEFEEFMMISELDSYLKNNPNLTQMLNGVPGIGDSVRLGMKKPDNGFRDVLREIKKRNSRGISKSTVNTF